MSRGLELCRQPIEEGNVRQDEDAGSHVMLMSYIDGVMLMGCVT